MSRICWWMTCLTLSLWANTSLEKSAKFLNSAEVFKVDFTLSQKLQSSPKSTQQSGQIWFNHQGSFLLKTAGIHISLDPTEYREFRPKSNQLLIKKAAQASLMAPNQLLNKYLTCPVLAESKQGSQILLKLNPAKSFKDGKSLQVWLSSQNYAPQKITFVDKNGNEFVYKLNSISAQKTIKNQFRIDAPKAEIVDMR